MKTKYIVSLLLVLAVLLGVFTDTQGQITYTESFDGAAFEPAGWTRTASNAAYQWDKASVGNNPDMLPHSGTGMLFFNSASWNNSGGTADMITPPFDLSTRGSSTVTVSLWVYRSFGLFDLFGNNNDEEIRVIVNTANSGTTAGSGAGLRLLGRIPRKFTEDVISSYLVSGISSPSEAGWYQYTFSIPSTYTGSTNYLCVRAVNSYGYNMYVDDVVWGTSPSTSPTVTVLGTPLEIFYSSPGTPSNEQSYVIAGTGLGNPIVIGVTAGFEISQTTGGPFSSSPITITPTSGSVYYQYVYVRSNSSSTGTFSGTITNSSVGATSVNVPVTGNNSTTICGTVNTYTVPAAGGVYYWNTNANWSKGRPPAPCEDVVVVFTPTSTSAVTAALNIDGAMTIKSLTIRGVWGTYAGTKLLQLQELGSYPISISGNLSISSNGGTSGSNQASFTPAGNCTIGGTVVIGQTGETRYSTFCGEAGSTPLITFGGNVTYNAYSQTSTSGSGTYIFNKAGSQTLTNNSTREFGNFITGYYGAVNFQNVIVGNSNTTILSLAGTPTYQPFVNAGDLTVNANSQLILPLGTTLNRGSTGGTLALGSGSVMKLSGVTGGRNSSNFPSGFTTFSPATTSTVEYDASTSTVQNVYGTTYGNLTITNSVQKSITSGTVSINGNLLIASGATFNSFSSVINLRGNWTNYGTFLPQTNKVVFDGTSGTQTIVGNAATQVTPFYDLTLSNTGATTDFGISKPTIGRYLATTAGTMNPGTSLITFNGGSGSGMTGDAAKNFYDLQINSGATVTHNATGSGVHIARNFTNNGAFSQSNTQSTYFDESGGTSAVSGTGTTTLGTLVIGGTGFSLPTTVNLSSVVTANGGLTLKTGVLTTTALAILKLGSAAAVSGGSDDSFVNGPMTRATASTGEYIFPVGDNTAPVNKYRPLSVTTKTAAASSFKGQYFYSAPPNNTNQLDPTLIALDNIDYWQVDRVSGLATDSAKIGLDYKNPGSGNWVMVTGDPIDPCTACNVAVARYGAPWGFTRPAMGYDLSVPEAVYYSSTGMVYSNRLVSFGSFAFGFGFNTILPISAITLSKTPTGLTWNADSAVLRYTVEYSTNGASYTSIGTGNGLFTQSLRDGFYRIKAITADGTTRYSNVISVTVQNPLLRLSPNPTQGMVFITGYDNKTPIYVTDITGKKLLETNSASIDLRSFVSGMYLITIGQKTFKVLKQ